MLRVLMPMAPGSHLVLADGHPCATNSGVLEPLAHQDRNEGQPKKEVVVKLDGRDAQAQEIEGLTQGDAPDGDGIDVADALWTIGQVDGGIEVVEKDADDLAKPQGHDGQIIAAQAQYREAKQYACERSQNARQRQANPE